MTTPYISGAPQTAVLTAYYFGGAYEVTGSDVKKYYSFGGQSILRDSTGLQYFLSDHLGSVVAITDDEGTLTSQQRYLPFGGVRTNIGSITQTDFGYTGQRSLDSGMGGLMDYKARMYSPALGRFLQPDSLIPNLSNPQSWNRYSYVVNRPINFNDPTGHTFEPPPCLCNYSINYSNTTGFLNTAIDVVATIGCLLAGCHIDRTTDAITGPTQEEAMNAQVIGMVNPIGAPASRITTRLGQVTDDVIYSGVRKASEFLQEIGVPRGYRKQILETFEIRSITVRTAGSSEYGMRYFDNINAAERGRFLFTTLPASRDNLALLPEWNAMTKLKQFQLRPGATLIEGIAAPKGNLRGGYKQLFTYLLSDLLEVRHK